MFASHCRQFVWNVWLEILTLDQVSFLYFSFPLPVMMVSFCTSLVHLRFEVGVERNQRFKI